MEVVTCDDSPSDEECCCCCLFFFYVCVCACVGVMSDPKEVVVIDLMGHWEECPT